MRWLPLLLLVTLAHADETKEIGSRSYLVHASKEFETSKNVPLVIFLHNSTESAAEASKSYGWEELADKHSFVALFPQATLRNPTESFDSTKNPYVWNDGSDLKGKRSDDVAFIKKVIEDVSTSYKIDPKRIYVTGFSKGASMAFRAGIELSSEIAAIAPVMGALELRNPKIKRPLSLYYVSGIQDVFMNSIYPWIKLLNLSPFHIVSIKTNQTMTTIYGPTTQGHEVVYVQLKSPSEEWPFSLNYYTTQEIWHFFDAVPR